MKTFNTLVKRHCKLFFKDKGVFFTSLATPMILLVLYATFLKNVYKDSFLSVIEGYGISLTDKVINGYVGGQLMSSLLGVSCVTVAFCSNLMMVTDKVSGVRKDFLVSPVNKSTLAISYFFATLINTAIVCSVATVLSLIYVGITGWFITFTDLILLLVDQFILITFGTALSSIVNYFLTSQGQISAVGSIVSSTYGFICGAYMPISTFSKGLQNAVGFFPGTYGTSLLKNHTLNGVFKEMSSQGCSTELVSTLREMVDCNIKFFNNSVSVFGSYLILTLSALALIGVYVLINVVHIKKKGN